MKARIFSLALAVAAIGVVGCNNPNGTPSGYGTTGAGSTSSSRPVEPRSETGAVSGQGTAGTGSSATIPSTSHAVKVDSQNLSQEEARTKRDEIYSNLYKQFLRTNGQGEKVNTSNNGTELNIPGSFKGDCKDVGKDSKFSSSNANYKAFFSKAEVQQQCAQAYQLDQKSEHSSSNE